jgi:3-carboxy-cis,cis-muconate cycloisomerase
VAGLLEALDGDPAVDRCVDDHALVRAMLDVESALARAVSRAGLVPAAAGEAVTAALADLDVDPDDLGARSRAAGNPVVPLVGDAVAAVPPDARGAVHLGATSQDVLDSALVLCARRALDPLLENLTAAIEAAGRLAEQHRGTLMVARTLGQPALPSTFGLKAAGWAAGLQAARSDLEAARDAAAAQLGGATGTLAAYGEQGLAVVGLLAEELGLTAADVPWHTERARLRRLACALAGLTTAAGKVATDVLLMSQAEVGEAAEGRPGGSSAMPHKQNPVASVLLVGAARRAPGLLATVVGAGLHEHERATGSWHAEWQPLRELVRLAGGAAARVRDLLEQLHVDADAMRRNLDAAGPGVLSEAIAAVLIPVLGRAQAQDVARRAVQAAGATGASLREALLAEPGVAELVAAGRVDADRLAAATTADGYLGSADSIIDRVLTAAKGEPR